MKVLLIGPDPSVRGGISQGIRLILQYPPPGVEFLMVPTLLPTVEAASIRGRSVKYLYRASRNLVFFARSLSRINSIVKQESPELAHLRFSSYGSTLRKGLIARYLARRSLPFILSAHSGAYEHFYNSLPELAQRWVRRMFSLSRGLIVLSESWKSFYSRILQQPELRIWVLPNAVEIPKEPLTWSVADPTRLLFLGRLGEHKGSDRVLIAMSKLPDEIRRETFLFMAGDGDIASMQKLAKQLGLEQQVQIRDWVSGDLKLQWLRETNVFILPSRDEGLPNALLEAMAWGKAVIASPVGGIPEYVSDEVEGYLIPAHDVAKLSQAIEQLTRRRELRVQMGKSARARVEPNDIHQHRQHLGMIYREALSHISHSVV